MLFVWRFGRAASGGRALGFVTTPAAALLYFPANNKVNMYSVYSRLFFIYSIDRRTIRRIIGKISKEFLDRINKITSTSNFNQWKNTTSEIEWFKAIENKQHHSFICFDIVEFYPSISQDLLNRAVDFASAYDNITSDERNIMQKIPF